MRRLGLLVWLAAAGCAHRPDLRPIETRSYHFLTTGNGHGFQVFDEASHRLSAFLDHPYRYLRAPQEFCQGGPQRRNLLEEFAFGIRRKEKPLWIRPGSGVEAAYLRQSNVIEAAAPLGESNLREYFFSPFGLERNALIALARIERDAGASGIIRLKFRLGANPKSDDVSASLVKIVDVPGARLQALEGAPRAWVQTGRGAGAVLYLALSNSAELDCETSGSPASVPPSFVPGDPPTSCAAGQVNATLRMPTDNGWFGVLIAYVDEPAEALSALPELRRWLADRAPKRLLDDALAEWGAWRKAPPARFRNGDEAKLWRQSEAVLRMAQVREPNIRGSESLRANHGMILASLAPGHWATGWVRDGAYATAALARMGHHEEAKKSLDFMINAEPIAHCSGQPRPNIEMDGRGLSLWAARQYLEASGDLEWLASKTRQGTVYDAMQRSVADAIALSLEPPPMPRIVRADSSIWETNDKLQHYAFTTSAGMRGLCDFAAIARKAGREGDAEKYATLAEEVRAGFLKAYVDPELGVLGALERSRRTDLDGSAIEALNLGALPEIGGAAARKTIQHLERLRLAQGGYKRNGGTDSYDANEWIFVDLRLASAFYRMGRAEQADRLVERIVRRATPNFNLIPEEYNDVPKEGRIGAYTGSIPMVGYGGGVFALALLDREGLVEPSSCGEWP